MLNKSSARYLKKSTGKATKKVRERYQNLSEKMEEKRRNGRESEEMNT